jgi:RHH-type rel operon transcriptional repressor/antitoxin RelB
VYNLYDSVYEVPMLAVRVPKKLDARLSKLAKLTGRPKSFYVRQALVAHLDEIEDTYTALYRLEKPTRRWTLDEIEKGLDQKVEQHGTTNRKTAVDRGVRRPRPARAA